jgi:hypothetical protein
MYFGESIAVEGPPCISVITELKSEFTEAGPKVRLDLLPNENCEVIGENLPNSTVASR